MVVSKRLLLTETCRSDGGIIINERDVLKLAILRYGEEAQLKMVLEEMSELQLAICKLWRGKDNIGNIAEEVADVEIMLTQLKMILNVENEVQQYRHQKIERLKSRLLGQEE